MYECMCEFTFLNSTFFEWAQNKEGAGNFDDKRHSDPQLQGQWVQLPEIPRHRRGKLQNSHESAVYLWGGYE